MVDHLLPQNASAHAETRYSRCGIILQFGTGELLTVNLDESVPWLPPADHHLPEAKVFLGG